ncbi:MAG: hypothetical protein D3915_02810 [Candidatus Electrothrix sp. AU1_5]|nr:hypothetical protein [Candidatus Electrothrix gigas]
MAIASRQLALELDIGKRTVQQIQFHWYQFDNENIKLTLQADEDWNGAILKELTPFSEFSHAEYGSWFKVSRKKRKGLPIYYDYRHIVRNGIKDNWVKVRQLMISILLLLGLKSSISEK